MKPKKSSTPKSKKRKRSQDFSATPTDTEWKRSGMTSLDYFYHESQGKKSAQTFFAVGDDVEANSLDGEDNVWIGRIYEIKAREDNKPWVKVYWYYSGVDILKKIENFPSDNCCPNERIISDHYNILEYDCFNKTVYVFPWIEDDLNPPEVKKGDFFQRYTYFMYQECIQPNPQESACIQCGVIYNPFPPVISVDPMHFCARPDCRKWYHRSCLRKLAETQSTEYLGSRGIQHLASDPDRPELHPEFAPFTYKSEPGGGKMASSDWADQRWLDIQDKLYTKLPPTLVQVAQQPILRCAGYEDYSISGNVQEVILARRLVYQVLEGWQRAADEVDQVVKPEKPWSDWKLEDLLEIMGPSTEYYRILSHTRIQASPFKPYWKHRQEKRDLANVEDIPFIRCPKCNQVV